MNNVTKTESPFRAAMNSREETQRTYANASNFDVKEAWWIAVVAEDEYQAARLYLEMDRRKMIRPGVGFVNVGN